MGYGVRGTRYGVRVRGAEYEEKQKTGKEY